MVGLSTNDKEKPVTYIAYDSNGKEVSRSVFIPKNYPYRTTATDIYSGDFMDELNGTSKEKPGVYTVVAHQGNQTSSLKLDISRISEKETTGRETRIGTLSGLKIDK